MKPRLLINIYFILLHKEGGLLKGYPCKIISNMGLAEMSSRCSGMLWGHFREVWLVELQGPPIFTSSHLKLCDGIARKLIHTSSPLPSQVKNLERRKSV